MRGRAEDDKGGELERGRGDEDGELGRVDGRAVEGSRGQEGEACRVREEPPEEGEEERGRDEGEEEDGQAPVGPERRARGGYGVREGHEREQERQGLRGAQLGGVNEAFVREERARERGTDPENDPRRALDPLAPADAAKSEGFPRDPEQLEREEGGQRDARGGLVRPSQVGVEVVGVDLAVLLGGCMAAVVACVVCVVWELHRLRACAGERERDGDGGDGRWSGERELRDPRVDGKRARECAECKHEHPHAHRQLREAQMEKFEGETAR